MVRREVQGRYLKNDYLFLSIREVVLEQLPPS